jgi:hypothetical protein
MIVRVRGSHDFFRNVCQYVRARGNELLSNVTSEDEAYNTAEGIIGELLEMLYFNYYGLEDLVPINDFDVFPDCDSEGELFEDHEESLNEDRKAGCDEEFISYISALFRLDLAIEQLAKDILETTICKRLQELGVEAA